MDSPPQREYLSVAVDSPVRARTGNPFGVADAMNAQPWTQRDPHLKGGGSPRDAVMVVEIP